MDIRLAAAADLPALNALDGRIESGRYLHLDMGGAGLAVQWRLDERPLRQRHNDPNPLSQPQQRLLDRLARGSDDGLALMADYDQAPIALALAAEERDRRTLHLSDLRVDPAFRRRGIATALLFRLTGAARDRGLRAVSAEAAANNLPACQLLLRCGFLLSGLDGRRHTNHDVVRESAALLFYAPLD